MSADLDAQGMAARATTPGGVATLSRQARAITVPTALGWDQTRYPLAITLATPVDGVRTGSAGFDPFASAVAVAAYNGARYYVSTTGSDTNAGTSTGAPLATIDKAVQLANAGGVPARVTLIATGNGYLGRVASAMGTTKPGVDLYFDTSGGRVKLGTYDTGYSWTANATYAWLYQITRSQVLRVVSPARLDRFGLFSEYAKVASLAACSQAPGSWYSDGTSLFVNPFDGVAPSDSSARPYLNVPLWTWTPNGATTPRNLFIDGVDFEGGKDSGFFVAVSAATGGFASGGYILAARNSSFRYGGGASANSGGVYINGWPGLVYASGSDASGGWSDLWNFHNAIPTLASMYVLTVNCTGSDAGRGGVGVPSNNGWTAHDDALIAIDVAGDYRGARGRTVHIIGNSKLLCAGTMASGSLGDIGNGGSFAPAEFSTGDTAQMWLDSVDPRPLSAAGQAIVAPDTSIAWTRNLPAVRGVSVATGGQIRPY